MRILESDLDNLDNLDYLFLLTVMGPLVVTTRMGGPPLPKVVEIRSLTRPLIRIA